MATSRAGAVALISFATLLAACAHAAAATLEVGPGKAFAGIGEAAARASAGDTIVVHPLPGGKAYEREALLVRTARLAFRGRPDPKGPRARIDGTGYEYSGAGSVPRAIFQLDPGADGCTVEGFELFGARNGSQNGAGVRTNQANDVTVRDCDIHDNDMGMMSNGQVADRSARGQRIERCRIHGNGSKENPGYNHNLYLGGTSLTLIGCEVFGSVTGHNVKSRAHYNRIEACWIHDSANRELDLVDGAGTTDAPGSHAVLIGNLIVKAREMSGNRTVIHFGQDGGKDHQGTIWLVHNTIVTPYIGPVVELSAPGTSAELWGNIVHGAGAGQRNQVLVSGRAGGKADAVRGGANWIDATFGVPEGSELAKARRTLAAGEAPPFLDPVKGDYRLRRVAGSAAIDAGVPLARLKIPVEPPASGASSGASAKALRLLEFDAEAGPGTRPRPDDGKPDLGSFEAR